MTVNGEAVKPGEGVEALILAALGGEAIEGDAPYIARALYRQPRSPDAGEAGATRVERITA